MAALFPALQDACATVTAVIGAAALIKAFDALTQAGWLDQVRGSYWCAVTARKCTTGHAKRADLVPVLALKKLSRKMVHMLAGPGFALCWPLFRCDALRAYIRALRFPWPDCYIIDWTAKLPD